jgi:hypothetical protein
VIAPKTEFDRIAERRTADDFDGCAIAEAHFEQASAQIRISADRDDEAAASDAKGVQRTSLY